MRKLLFLALILSVTTAYAAKPKHQYIRIKTNAGECIIKLYNETPLHRDNILKLIKKKVYDSTLFHRVIKDFTIQGGDPDSKSAQAGAMVGEGTVGYTVPAEFKDSLFHKKGVLGAARDDNPEKASSGSQFYIVQGKIFTDQQLDEVETKRLKFKIPEWQREVYKTIGGTPHLDRNYTVYGEVVKGLEMVEKVSLAERDTNDRPIADIKMSVTVLKRREVRKLEKELKELEKTTASSIK